VDGQYTGTTDQIMQWGTCKWGLDPDVARANAVSETNWNQGSVGDHCGSTPNGSFGIRQLMNGCNGSLRRGGYAEPTTRPRSTSTTGLAIFARASTVRSEAGCTTLSASRRRFRSMKVTRIRWR
jgi:hypothetical protein